MSRLFERNGALKIISVLFAVILWLYAVSELNPEITTPVNNVPIKIINEDLLKEKDMILTYDPANRINIRVRGLTNDIRHVNTADIKATLDLNSVEAVGTQQISLKIEGLPKDIRLDKIPTIPISVNNLASKEIPISISLTNDIPEGYFLHPPSIEPKSMVLTGAESLVKNVVQGIIDMDIDNTQGHINESLPIRLVDSEGDKVESKYIYLQQDYAMVSLLINPMKTIPVEANVTGNPADGYEVAGIEMQPRQITINADEIVLESIKNLPTNLVDIQGARGDITSTVDFQEIEGVYIDSSEPRQVSIVVRIKEKIVEKNITINNAVSFRNVPDGMEVVYQPDTPIVFKAKGLYTLVNSLNNQSVSVSADLTGISEPGDYELPLAVHVPEGIEIQGMPETITVTLAVNDETEVTEE